MSRLLHWDHQELREQLSEFGIESYIVGQKIEGGAASFRVAEVDHTSRSPVATLRERNKLEFPDWMTVKDGARYLIMRYMEDKDELTRSTISEVVLFSEQLPEQDFLHAAYVPLEVPLDHLLVESSK